MVVLSQLFGAVVRAVIVASVVATPSLLLPGTTAEGAQMTMLLALILAVVVAWEYGCSYPAIISFRDAPPLNRARILTLFAMLWAMSSAICYDGSSTTGLVLNAIGLMVGRSLEFPFSPVALLLAQTPAGSPAAMVDMARILAGLAVFFALLTGSLFTLLVGFGKWPGRDRAFNLWVNLPNFDPTSGPDVAKRLYHQGGVNILLALAAPFLIPVAVGALFTWFGFDPFETYQVLVWGIALWAFIPLSLFMRGLAMRRLARMIRTQRARLMAGLHADAPRQFA